MGTTRHDQSCKPRWIFKSNCDVPGGTLCRNRGRLCITAPYGQGRMDMVYGVGRLDVPSDQDRKSTRLNSSHGYISYAVFCLKKKNRPDKNTYTHKITVSR